MGISPGQSRPSTRTKSRSRNAIVHRFDILAPMGQSDPTKFFIPDGEA